jgi:hypothetical protein
MFLLSMVRLLVTADFLSSPILVTLVIEALSSSETSVPTTATRRNIFITYGSEAKYVRLSPLVPVLN